MENKGYLWDYVLGLKAPLINGFTPVYDGTVLSFTSFQNLISSYGAGFARLPLRQLLAHFAHNVSQFLDIITRNKTSIKMTEKTGVAEALLVNRSLSLTIRVWREPQHASKGLFKVCSFSEENEGNLLTEAASRIILAPRYKSRRVGIVDTSRNTIAMELVLPSKWHVSSTVFPDTTYRIIITGPRNMINIEANSSIIGPGLNNSVQLASSAVDLLKTTGEWDRVWHAGIPTLMFPKVAEALISPYMGGHSQIESVIGIRPGEAAWSFTANISIPIPLVGSYYTHQVNWIARSQGEEALTHLLVIMAHSKVKREWINKVNKEMQRLSRELGPRGPSWSELYAGYSNTTPLYDYHDSYAVTANDPDLSYDYETGSVGGHSGSLWDKEQEHIMNEPDLHGTSMDETASSWDEHHSMETEATTRYEDELFYFDDTGTLRTIDTNEPVATDFDEDGYLRDSEGRVVGKLERGYIVDPNTGEKRGVLDLSESSEYWVEKLEENLRNPEEQLGWGLYGPDITEKRMKRDERDDEV